MGAYVVSAFMTFTAVGLLWACGTSSDASPESILACQTPGDQTIGAAVTEYVKTTTPTPYRFLLASGTDSALGDGGLRALQDKGPTFLFPPTPEQQATVRKQLASLGSYTTLLVALKQNQKVDDTTAVIRLHGTYVGGEEDGMQSEPKELYFACRYANWHLKNADGTQSM